MDLAIEGIAPDDYFKAYAVLEKYIKGRKIDLVDMKDALPAVLGEIETQGIEL